MANVEVDGVAVDVADVEVEVDAVDGVAVDVDSLLGITITPRDRSSFRLSGRSIGVKNT